jgi:hypothetical protein
LVSQSGPSASTVPPSCASGVILYSRRARTISGATLLAW